MEWLVPYNVDDPVVGGTGAALAVRPPQQKLRPRSESGIGWLKQFTRNWKRVMGRDARSSR